MNLKFMSKSIELYCFIDFLEHEHKEKRHHLLF